MKPNYIFETEMEVRDYECDIQGIVNNANYLHYTEHTRHLYLTSLGVSFARLHEKGVDAVVARMNLQYKTPLRCDDVFVLGDVHPQRHGPALSQVGHPGGVAGGDIDQIAVGDQTLGYALAHAGRRAGDQGGGLGFVFHRLRLSLLQ